MSNCMLNMRTRADLFHSASFPFRNATALLYRPDGMHLFDPFLPRDAMHKCGLCRPVVSVCLPVCLLHSWILSKRINISSIFFHHRVATQF